MNKPLNIQIAPQDAIDTFPKEVDRLLSVLGHAEAMVTDESTVSDFMIFIAVKDPEIDQHNAEILEGLAELMARPVEADELLWQLAAELHRNEQPRTLN